MPGPLTTTRFEVPIGCWNLTSAAPSPDLAGVVELLWEGVGDLPPFTEKILPRGNIELMFNLGAPHRLLSVDGVPCDEPYVESWISGLQRRYLTVMTPNGSHLLSASLTPWGAWRLLRAPMRDIACRVPLLSDIWGSAIAALEDRLNAAGGPARRFELLEAFIRRELDQRRSPKPWLIEAGRQLRRERGTVRIETVCRAVGVSRGLLSRAFRDQVGVTPKTYARIWRVNALLDLNGPPGNWAQLADELGYHDQSHLIHDFRDFTGATPQEYIATRSPDGGAMLIDF